MPSIRAEIIFHGQVQGVGFRWTTERLATARALRGWVRNEPDGTVRMVAEGPREALDALLEELDQRLPGHIRHRDCVFGVSNGEFSGFRILQQ